MLRDIKDEKTFYAFKYDLGMGGDTNVALDGGNAVIAEFDGFEGEVQSVKWMDNSHDLDFAVEDGKLRIACTNFRYGQSHCVRVAEIKVK